MARHVPPGAERPVKRATDALIDGALPAAIARPVANIEEITGRRRAADIAEIKPQNGEVEGTKTCC